MWSSLMGEGRGGLEMMTSLYFPILFVKKFSQIDDLRGGGGKNPKFLMRSFVNDSLVPLSMLYILYTHIRN